MQIFFLILERAEDSHFLYFSTGNSLCGPHLHYYHFNIFSIPGRIFSVVWISMGIIAYGFLTGIVVAQVMEINSPPPPDMTEKNIGSLLYREYDATVLAQNGKGRSCIKRFSSVYH